MFIDSAGKGMVRKRNVQVLFCPFEDGFAFAKNIGTIKIEKKMKKKLFIKLLFVTLHRKSLILSYYG
jgi:hypothetical protein